MKRFQKRKKELDTVFALTDEGDYLSEFVGEPVSSSGDKSRKSITDVLEEYEFPGKKKQKLDDLMHETREIGMGKSILSDENTKGVKLMKLFGFLIDSSKQPIISSEADTSNLKDPIKVEFVRPREKAGLGMKEHLHRMEKEKLEKIKRIHSGFTQLKTIESRYAKKRKEYMKILKVIYELDVRDGDDEFSLPETKEMHEFLQNKLFKNKSDFNEEEEHHSEEGPGLPSYYFPSLKDINGNEELLRTHLLELENRIFSLLCHLRESHCYCYYCQLQCDDEEDLMRSCSLVTESDHEDD
jgi:hypothetical protein